VFTQVIVPCLLIMFYRAVRAVIYQLAAFVFLAGAASIALVTMAFEKPPQQQMTARDVLREAKRQQEIREVKRQQGNQEQIERWAESVRRDSLARHAALTQALTVERRPSSVRASLSLHLRNARSGILD
jgi:heme exporter protein D